MSTYRHALLVTLYSGMALSVRAESVPLDSTRQEQARKRIDHERRLIREGLLDPRLAISPLVLDDRYPAQEPRSQTPSSHTLRAHNVNQPWGALIDSDDFVLDFEDPAYQITTLNPTSGTQFISLSGTTDPSGETWWAPIGDAYTGIVDNDAAQGGGNWDPDGGDDDPLTEGILDGDPNQHGEVGGPDPLGLHGKFVAAAAGSHTIQQTRTTGARPEGWMSHKYYTPRAKEPVVVLIDVYQDRVDSKLWYSPISESDGNFFVVSSYWLGYTFTNWAYMADPDNVIRRPIMLYSENPDRGLFCTHPHSSPWRIKTDEWYSIGIRKTVDSYSVWVRDSQTIGLNGFEQNSVYDAISGASDPGDTRGAFAGEIFENDWLQVHPGVDDDPATTSVEGYGVVRNEYAHELSSWVISDSSGSPAMRPAYFMPLGIDAIHWRGGFDPEPTFLPTFVPNDYYLDNYVVMGTPYDVCRSDINGDGVTDGEDLGLLLGTWGEYDILADQDGTVSVSGSDLGLLLANWGPCP